MKPMFWAGLLLGVALAWCYWRPELLPVVALAFVQNVAFTFVSRARNSPSLAYHLGAAVASNGIWAALFLFNIKEAPQAAWQWVAVYTMTTVSGSVFAHWLAKLLEGKVIKFKPFTERLMEVVVNESYRVRVWTKADIGEREVMACCWGKKFDDMELVAELIATELNAEAVQVSDTNGCGYVHYRSW